MRKDEAKNLWIALIECWKEKKCLWDTADHEYHSRTSRNKAYFAMLKVYRKINPSASVVDLRSKLYGMKCTYRNQFLKVKRYRRLTGSKGMYVPKLWYYERLLFLDNKDVTRTGCDSFGDENCDNQNIHKNSRNSNGGKIDTVSQKASQGIVPEQHQTVMSASTRGSLNNQDESLLDNLNNPMTAKENEWEVIMKYLMLQLKNIEPKQQDFAQKLFSDIILYGKCGKLSHTTTISLEPPNLNCSAPLPRSVWYNAPTPPSSRSSPAISCQPDNMFSFTPHQMYLRQHGKQSASSCLGTPLHHTLEETQMLVGATTTSGMKKEEIIVSD